MDLVETSRITHERIKANLRIRNDSLAKLSRRLGVSYASMSLASLGKNRSARIEKAIAEALETTPQNLWPERYGGRDEIG